jgi:hypothetical protein
MKTIIESPAQTANTFKTSWTEQDFKTIKTALRNFFLFRALHTKDGIKNLSTFAQLEELLGLPYTSSSSYAGLWVTNTELNEPQFPGYHYIGFAIAENGNCFGVMWDKDENEKIIRISKNV